MPANIHNADDAIGPEVWFRSLGFVTQYWFGSAMVFTIAANLDIVVSPSMLAYSWMHIKDKFELWRLLTPFVFGGGFSFNLLITLYMLYTFSNQYEKGGPFNTGAGGGTADYIFALMFGAAMLFLTRPLSPVPLSPFMLRNLMFYILYIWSKKNPSHQSNIWGIPVQALYLPFVYVFVSMLMNNPYEDLIQGMAVGHLYYFLVDVVPRLHGKDVLTTPRFLIDQFGVGEYQPQAPTRNPENLQRGWGPGVRQQQSSQPNNSNSTGGTTGRGGGHNWGGGGRALGRD